MLKSFEVSNFKSIKHLELELRPFMVLVGPNGAGKTNVVQALELLGEMMRQGSIEPVRALGYDEIIRREQRPARAGLTLGATFELSLRDLRLRPPRPAAKKAEPLFQVTYRVVVRGSVKEDEIHLHEEELIIRQGQSLITLTITEKGQPNISFVDADPLDRFAEEFFDLPSRKQQKKQQWYGQLLEQLELMQSQSRPSWLRLGRLVGFELALDLSVHRLRLDASTLRQDATTRDRAVGLIGPAGEGLAMAVDKIRGHDEEPHPRFTALLRQLNTVYPRIEDIEPFRLQPGRMVLLFKERGISEQLGQSSVSDGILHALGLLLALESRERGLGIVVIEEPENAIHPWPLRQLMIRAQEKARRPLIITTHSNVVVDAIQDPGALFVVEQVEKEGTKVTPARDKEHALDSILKESGLKLGDVWLNGGIGGVPTQD